MSTRSPASSRNFLSKTGIYVLLRRIATKLIAAIRLHVAVGYEDEAGFHFGKSSPKMNPDKVRAR